MSRKRAEKSSEVDILWNELPSLFQIEQLPPGWDDQWIAIPIDSPESAVFESSPEQELFSESLVLSETIALPSDSRVNLPAPISGTFPGALQNNHNSPNPPPDAFAFYLPFHYFYPKWWGIYLLADGVRQLGEILYQCAGGKLAEADCRTSARIFLFGHEQFHHSVESFATRLEITHRLPIYKEGFEKYYQRTRSTPEWLEEALANASAYRRVTKAYSKEPAKRRIVEAALQRYIENSPPGYNQGMKYVKKLRFDDGEDKLAETGHRESCLNTPQAAPSLWKAFGHGFHPFRKRGSRVVYLVHRDSPIAHRSGLGGRYLRYREVVRRLREQGCLFVREGKGSHEIWRGPNQRTFPVPRHPADFKIGTLAGILRQAGLQMRVEEFLRGAG